VAEQHHRAGLHLADERDDVDEQREPGHPRRYLANSSLSSIGVVGWQYGNNDYGSVARPMLTNA
jgi:hypothetical protein